MQRSTVLILLHAYCIWRYVTCMSPVPAFHTRWRSLDLVHFLVACELWVDDISPNDQSNCRGRPWEMTLVLYGFPTKVSMLIQPACLHCVPRQLLDRASA